MKFFRRTNTQEKVKVKEAILALDEAELKYRDHSEGFKILRDKLEKDIRSNPEALVRVLEEVEGRTAREFVYSWLGNFAGNFLESGDYHVWRGVLMPGTPCDDFLAIFDSTLDELVHMKSIDSKFAEKQKRQLRANIKSNG